METNLYCYTRTGRTISEKTMEDGNNANTKDDKHALASLANCYDERSFKLTANGHDLEDGPPSPPGEARAAPAAPRRASAEAPHPDRIRKRINPLRIHLGKRPFVDNSQQYCGTVKKKRPSVNKPIEPSILPRNNLPRVPKLIPKRLHNVMPTVDNSANDSEHNKPVPRLVPKSQLAQFKKGKLEKGSQLKEYAQSLGLQPMVKFKCRKCCSMSFKTLAMLKEHQLVCRAQAKEPALSPEAAPNTEASTGGPSRVTRKVYLCSACGTYYENWNLFLHMREVHNRHICLFCLGMFSKAEKLSAHLTNKHNVQEFNYETKEDFFNVYNGTLYLMCCMCDEICSEKDDFFNHDCNNVKPKPVPVLVSKNAVKPNNVTKSKTNDSSVNGPATVAKEFTKHVNDNRFDKKDIVEEKLETVTSQSSKVLQNTNDSEPLHSDTSISSDNSTSSGKDTSKDTKDSGMELDSSSTKPTSPLQAREPSSEIHNDHHNGEDNSESSEESDSQTDERHNEYNPSFIPPPTKPEEPICPPVEREKEGIKLKLSLNNANSPVIINSTVDPTVGQHSANKPPSRMRRPPKRYEKDAPQPQHSEKDTPPPQRYERETFAPFRYEKDIPETPFLPKTPSIKMTICDKADSPFVKTTIYENDQDTTLKALLNNNLENTTKTPEYKPENTIKTTIYDNKVEDDNAMNRVPKLTVRVPKELLDKDSSSDDSSDSDYGDKLTVDENQKDIEPPLVPNQSLEAEPTVSENSVPPLENVKEELDPGIEEPIQVTDDIPADVAAEPKTETTDDVNVDVKVEDPTADELPLIQLNLDRPLDKYPLKDLLKVFLASTIFNCVYCNHVRKIAVNCEHLCLHMVEQHRFCATVDSITAEELLPETITAKVRAGAAELSTVYINLDSYDSADNSEGVHFDHIFECFQCFFKTPVHKDLYLHNRKMHQRTILLCVMCKSNFYSYSELLCHLCPGTYDSEYEIKFRCCLCNVDSIPSSFRLMVHLRKIHHACNVCLEFCHSQSRLSNHVWKHKLHHLCYRCGIAYRNKPDITKHLFWKHGTESVMCKKCMQKKWPHVYHFCTPPTVFACDECNLQFTRAVYLKVHKRFHSEEFPHVCTEEGCTEKFVSKKLLKKHADEHIKKLFTEDLNAENPTAAEQNPADRKDPIPVIDLVNDKPEEAGTSDIKSEPGSELLSKKSKKKKLKDKDALLLDVNLPALNLSESDSSDESDSGGPPATVPAVVKDEETADEEKPEITDPTIATTDTVDSAANVAPDKVEEEAEPAEVKPEHEKVLEIYHNLQKYQAKAEKEKTPPLVPIRKHVCESDHDYCLIPNDLNGDEDMFSLDKKKNRKSPKKRHGGLSSSSSSSSDSDSSCSCGSNCSCSSSSGSSSSSSSDSDSSDESGNEKKKNKQLRKTLPNRRLSNGSNVDVMGMSETPILVPEKPEPPINETDLETDESETDEEFYDEHPQKLANKLHAEKRNQLLLLASVAPSDGGSVSGEPSRAATPVKEVIEPKIQSEIKEKPSSSKKKSKKKKKSKSSKKHAPIKVNIPKDIIAKSEMETPVTPLIPNKMTISLKSNTVHIPEAPIPSPSMTPTSVKPSTPAVSVSDSSKRASKRRRVPNKFYGYCEDDGNQQATTSALKPHLPPKLEWRKEDLPSPVTHKAKKDVPSTTLSHRMYNYPEPTHTHIRLTAPIPDPEPPRILMNSESMDSSDSDSSEEGALEIFQPLAGYGGGVQAPAPAPTYLNSGTSSLPYPFQRPPVRQAREGESVYCYCRCPYDEVSEMIACDAEGCAIEWFHFECVGIMVPPKGKWYCPECRKNQSFSGYR
ncbi:uncharacterized protein LOC134649026 [Cydia amplana]|uniref:uncharacterized protein LOC134649026 n=1 Tax=Cydia amplana TaxID=1869771 RepID=UPI002FE59583